MKICIYIEQYIAGGVDTAVLNKINSWPDTNDEIALICNPAHDGLQRILAKRIKRKADLFILPVKTLPAIYKKHLPSNRILSFLFKAVWFYPRYLLFIYNIILIAKLFRKISPDAVFIHNGNYPGGDSARAAVFSAKISGVKKIFMVVHNLAVKPKTFQLIFEFALDRFIDKNARIICVSREAAKALARNRFIKQEISVIYNGVQPDEATENEINEFRNSLGLLPGQKIISMVSSFEPRKGHDNLFAALSILKNEYRMNNFRCLIFGKGTINEERRVREDIVNYGVEKEVIVCGFRPDIQKFFRLFDCFILASTGFEACPMVILEAMSAGVPIVSTNAGGAKELVRDNITGFIVPANNPEILAVKIRNILQNNELAGKLSNNSSKIFETEFTALKMTEQYRFLAAGN